MVKVMIFDLDGTLLDKASHTMSKKTLTTLKRAQSLGIKLILATGRHLETMDPFILKALDMDAYVLMNGHMLLDQNKNVVKDYPLPSEDAQALIEQFEALDMAYTIHAAKGIIYQEASELTKAIEAIHHHNQGMHQQAKSEFDYEHIYSFMVEHDDEDQLNELIKDYPHYKTENFYPSMYDIYSKAINKANGIEVFLDQWQLSWDDCLVFGDSYNDIQMLERAGYAYVINNEHKRLAHLNYPMIESALSDDFGRVILSFIPSPPTTSNTVSFNHFKTMLLISVAFFIFAIHAYWIQKSSAWILYLLLALALSLWTAYLKLRDK